MVNKTIYVGADHAGFRLKEHIKRFLEDKKYSVVDVGAYEVNKDDDYPVYAFRVAEKVSKTSNKGILVCGSAEGVCIAANKVKNVRAVPVWSVKNAKLSREHNDANILCLSGWQLSKSVAENIVLSWLKAKFSEEKRHKRRINQIKDYEDGCYSRHKC